MIKLAHLPTQVPTNTGTTLSVQQFLKLMAGDKKVLGGQLHLVLLNALGSSFISSDFDVKKLKQTLEAFATA